MSSKPKEEAFKKGDKVQARWSGSKVYYDAKILDVLSKNYKVQYSDGSILSVKLSDVKALKSEKEMAKDTPRSKSRSRSRSAGRKSVGRTTSRSRSRSPSRKTEKKPLTQKAEKPKVEKSPNLRVEKRKPIESINSAKNDEVDRLIKSPLLKESSSGVSSSFLTRNSYTVKQYYPNVQESTSDAVHLRSSSRLAALQTSIKTSSSRDESPASTSKKQNALTKEKEAQYSDDESEVEMEVLQAKKPSVIVQLLYSTYVLLKMILMPAVLLFLIYSCTRKQCTVLEIPHFYSSWRDVESSIRIPLLAIGAFHVVLCVLSVLPLAKKVNGFPYGPREETQSYRLNGFYSLLVSLTAFCIFSYFEFYMNWGFDKFKSIALSSLIYCTFWSWIMYTAFLIKGNGDISSKGMFLNNFYNGAYINPRIFTNVDIKSSFIHLGLIGMVLMNMSILLKFYFMKSSVALPHALTFSMQLFYIMDLLWREEKLLSSATYTSDGVGYGFLLTNGFIVPMALTLQNVYHFIYAAKFVAIPYWCSIAILCLFFCGYYIYMTSSNLKHNFRRNPFSPSLSAVTSLPTSKKKRLITTGWWGIIRHPNYLGLLIMAIAWTLPCGFNHLVPFGPVIMLAIALIIRCFRIERECADKYGPAWSNYTDKVRSRILPYIF